ncbi:MAG: NnrS family protein [Formivibrio sp.]|nr:NnrS family protein [Formivibrio sp.]
MKTVTAFVAPHRTGFLLGSLLLLTSLGWWSMEMIARQRGVVLGMAMPAMFLHGYLMLYGFFPLFMLGFIYTAGPRWLGVTSITLSSYVPVMLGYVTGSVLVLAGGWFHLLLSIGILVHIVSWSGALMLWLGRIRASKASERRHAMLIAAAFMLGLLGQILGLLWSAGQWFSAWQASVDVGLWGFLLPVFLIVCHRMVPFFSSNVLMPYSIWNPQGLLYTLVGMSWAHGFLARVGWMSWPVDMVFAGILAYIVWRWGFFRAFKVPLLAMLHASLAWTAVALVLYSVQGVAAMMGVSLLAFAPLHALTLGFFCTMLLGFVTRVSLGHSGRPLVAGRLPWTLYWLVHCIALTRVVADIVPGWQQPMYLFSVSVALLAFLLWGTRFVPIYLKPRIDGKLG